MKKNILIFLVLLLTTGSALAQANDRYVYAGDLYLNIYEAGVITPDKIKATVLVSNWRKEGKGDGVTWTQTYLRRMDKIDSVRLETDRYLSELGEIKNLVIEDDSVAFDLDVSHGSGKLKMHVTMNKSFPGVPMSGLEDITATGHFYKGGKAKYKVEWKEAAQDYFILPYDKVY